MNLILTSISRLKALYGDREARRIVAAIAALAQVRASAGLPSRLLVAELGDAEYAVPPAEIEAAALARQVGAFANALEARGQRLASLLIVGGHAIIPFVLATNPTPADGDPFIPSDTVYTVRNPGALMPEWPVGRLPGAEGANANSRLLLGLLQTATRLHQQKSQLGPSFGYTAAVWQEAANVVYAAISAAPLLASPPVVASTLGPAMNHAWLVYCNLHGIREGTTWYGQAENEQNYLVALELDMVQQARVYGAVVLSEACYGAAVLGRNERESLALAFLAQGAACFVGATAMSYAPASAPLGEADLFAMHFLRELSQGATQNGRAFANAVAGMLFDMFQRQGGLDGDDQKTVLEFILYGDPTLAPGIGAR